MTALDPQFNGWAFSGAGFTTTDVEFQLAYPERAQKAVQVDGGVAQEGALHGRIIRLSGKLVGTSTTDVRDKFGSLIKRLRGTDRQKKGRLDIHGDGHYYAQLVSSIPARLLPGQLAWQVQLEFFADDPFRRTNTVKAISETPTAGTPTVTISNGAGLDFAGDAPRMPVVLDCNTGWQAGNVLRLVNQLTGARFEYVVKNNLTVSQSLVIDGETHEILEADTVTMEGVAGVFPYLRGGADNIWDFTGTTAARLGVPYIFTFWDRYFG